MFSQTEHGIKESTYLCRHALKLRLMLYASSESAELTRRRHPDGVINATVLLHHKGVISEQRLSKYIKVFTVGSTKQTM